MNIPTIKNAFSNVKDACNHQLTLLYPAGIPEFVKLRYELELSFLKDSNVQDNFEILRLLFIEAKKSSTLIGMRGTIMGSFIYYLLSNNSFNPLPAHYYCPECGYFEQPETHLFGIDLPEKSCPHCGKTILADGFNLSPESVWGTDGKKIIAFEYNINTEFLSFARRLIVSLYPDNPIVPLGVFHMGSYDKTVGVNPSGYAILPSNHTIDDYSDLISYLENGDICITGGSWVLENRFIKPIRLIPVSYMDYLLSLQRATGIYVNEITAKKLRGITWHDIGSTTILNATGKTFFQDLQPKTFRDMVAVEASCHNTFSWQDSDERDLYDYKKMLSSNAFQKYPCFTRDDFFDHMINSGIERKYAFEISERIRKGHAVSPKHKEEFDTLPIPDELKEVARNYHYLFPRAHCVEYILIFARLTYYAKIDSHAFSKIVFKKNLNFGI